MEREQFVTGEFEAHRHHLRAVAYRMLGSTAEADDAVQEAWFRLARVDTSGVENMGGWLTTVVARVCLDMLRSRTSRREDPIGDVAPDEIPEPRRRRRPRARGDADRLCRPRHARRARHPRPGRAARPVLHDMFGVPFDEIATVVGCSPAAARQHASRARWRVRGVDPTTGAADLARRQQIVEAFLAAARGGDFDALLSLLAPDAVLQADAVAVAAGAAGEATGATAVAEVFAGRAKVAQPALLDGAAGAAWAQAGTVRVVFDFTIVDGRIVGIDLIMDPATIAEIDVQVAGM